MIQKLGLGWNQFLAGGLWGPETPFVKYIKVAKRMMYDLYYYFNGAVRYRKNKK